MKSVLLPLALSLATFSAPALAQDQPSATPPELQIFRDTDAALTCRQISEEAAGLSETMGGSEGGGVFSALGGVARTGAAMLIPGAGLAMAGADVLTAPSRERREARHLAVQNRWYYLNGLFTGQNCAAEMAAAVAPAPAAPATAPQPAITPVVIQ